MNVLLINPKIKKETQSPLFTSLVFSSIPLGLGYIAAFLRQERKLNPKIIDEVTGLLKDDDLKKELDAFRGPLLVGLSCLTSTYSRAVELAEKIKQIKRDTFIVFGGVHPSALPEEGLNTGVVDATVRGEGEITMLEIYDAFISGKGLTGIRGVSYMEGRSVYHNSPREYTDLNILPKFPYDLFDKNLSCYSDFGMILSSRGCPFNCIFCSNRIVTGKKYRTFSVPYVVDQLDVLIRRYRQKSINFVDDNIVVDKKHFFDLTNAIIENDFHKKAYFTGQCRGEDMNEEVVKQLKKANFRMIYSGIETSSERLMKILKKNERVSDIKRGIEMAHAGGMLTGGAFILGIPTETLAERRDSMRFARELPLDSARFNIPVPYPGTHLFEIAKRENRLHIAKDWKNFSVQYYLFGDDIPYVPTTTGRYSLIFDTMWANIRFYLRPKILMTIIFKTENTGGGVISLQNRRNVLATYITLLKIAFFLLRRFVYVGISALFERKNTPS